MQPRVKLLLLSGLAHILTPLQIMKMCHLHFSLPGCCAVRRSDTRPSQMFVWAQLIQRTACNTDILGAFVRLLHKSKVGTENSPSLPKLGGSCVKFSSAILLCTGMFSVQGHYMCKSIAAALHMSFRDEQKSICSVPPCIQYLWTAVPMNEHRRCFQ